MEYELTTEIGDGQEVVVKFDYQPAEPMIRYGSNSQPAFDAEVDITSICIPGSALCFKDDIKDSVYAHIEDLCFAHVEREANDAKESFADWQYENWQDRRIG